MGSGSFRVKGKTSRLMQQKATRRNKSAKLSPDPSKENEYWLSFTAKSLTGAESESVLTEITFLCCDTDRRTTNDP